MALCNLLILAIFGFGLTCALEDNLELDLEKYLREFTDVRHPAYHDGVEWLKARDFIVMELQLIGLQVEIQAFNTSIMTANGTIMQVEGLNIISIAHGSDHGKILVVGADYDTSLPSSTSPLGSIKDNGSGMAVLLETARHFRHVTNGGIYHQNYTVIFVAFDLNTRDHSPKSPGLPGSEVFVKDWLVPYLKNTNSGFDGAVILDSVSTYNINNFTQNFPSGFTQVFPEEFEVIKQTNFKGNFLALTTLNDEDDVSLAIAYETMFNMKKITKEYRAQKFVLKMGSSISDQMRESLHKHSSFHFWTNDPRLPALLLTDTEHYRVDPCVTDNICDRVKFYADQRKEFMEQLTLALINLLVEKQTSIKPAPSSSSILLPSGSAVLPLFTLSLLAFLGKALLKCL